LEADTKKLAGETAPKGQQSDPRAAKAAEHLKNAATHQEAAARNLSIPSLPEAQKAQGKAIKEIRKALESMKGKDANNGRQGEKPAGSQEKPQPKPNAQGRKPQSTPPPRDETAGDILDQEKEDRQRRTMGQPGGYKPVDKDW
jgi:hypothetical protein